MKARVAAMPFEGQEQLRVVSKFASSKKRHWGTSMEGIDLRLTGGGAGTADQKRSRFLQKGA
jgi:hypothetical protein